MTVKELKELLNELPEDMDVFIDERITDFTYGLANSVTVKQVNMIDEPGGEVIAIDEAVIISEE